jgi:hypothetical protein
MVIRHRFWEEADIFWISGKEMEIEVGESNTVTECMCPILHRLLTKLFEEVGCSERFLACSGGYDTAADGRHRSDIFIPILSLFGPRGLFG